MRTRAENATPYEKESKATSDEVLSAKTTPVEARKPIGAEAKEVDTPSSSEGDEAQSHSRGAAFPGNQPASQGSSADTPEQAQASAGSTTEAFDRARVMMENSRGKANKGKASQAYRDAQRAWELVQPFPNDAQCRQLAAEAESAMKSLAKAANAKYSDDQTTHKTLIEQ